MSKTTPTRAPTVEERQRRAAPVNEVDEDRAFWNQIIDQLRGSSDIHAVVHRLKAVREQQGTSLRLLEETTGITRGNLSRLENYQHTPGLDTLQRYAEAPGKTVRMVIIDE